MRLLAIALVALSLAGCKTTGTPDKLPAIQVTSDSYCKIAKRRTWSVNDTTETIDEARREKAKFEKICGGKAVS